MQLMITKGFFCIQAIFKRSFFEYKIVFFVCSSTLISQRLLCDSWCEMFVFKLFGIFKNLIASNIRV